MALITWLCALPADDTIVRIYYKGVEIDVFRSSGFPGVSSFDLFSFGSLTGTSGEA